MPNRNAGSGVTAWLMLFFALFLLVFAHVVAPVANINLPWQATIFLTIFGGALLVVGSIIIIITRLYIKTPADMAIVKTGMGGQRVIIDGGMLFIPVVHQLIYIPLRSMRLEVQRTGADALLTADNLRADITAEFYVKIPKKAEFIQNAASSLGEGSINQQSIIQLVQPKLVSYLRQVAREMTLEDLLTKRKEFVQAVQGYVETDIMHNGLQLESVSISKLDQTPAQELQSSTNIFDAQGARKIAQITAEQNVETNNIRLKAEQDIKTRETETRRAIYEQDVALAQADANKNLEIARTKAQTDAEAEAERAKQQQISELARVATDQAVQVAEVNKGREIQVANQQREQAEAVARVEREQAEQVASQNREIAVAERRRLLAEATAQQAEAEAEAEKQRQAVKTVEVTANAERDAKTKVIAAEATANQERLSKNVEVDVQAYRTKQLAEAGLAAASQEAQAMTTRAEAEKQAAVLRAQGLQAEQLVPVEVKRREVDVENARVDVLARELATRQEHSGIARDLEIALAAISADKEVRIEQAKAMGVALSQTNMTVWGTPEQVQKITNSFMLGQSVSHGVNGALAALSPEMRAMVEALGAEGISQLLSKLSSNGTSPEDKQHTGVGQS